MQEEPPKPQLSEEEKARLLAELVAAHQEAIEVDAWPPNTDKDFLYTSHRGDTLDSPDPEARERVRKTLAREKYNTAY